MVTENIKAIADFIDRFITNNGHSPTIREIEQGTGISKSAVARYLKRMKEEGVIEYNGRRTAITKKALSAIAGNTQVPVLGSVSCGPLKWAEGSVEEYVSLPKSIFGEGEFFLLRADGDSMIEAGIDIGDLVLVKHQSVAQPGDIVVALVENETTLKRYFPEPKKRRFRLHPENSKLDDIYVKECVIQGVAVHVIKPL